MIARRSALPWRRSRPCRPSNWPGPRCRRWAWSIGSARRWPSKRKKIPKRRPTCRPRRGRRTWSGCSKRGSTKSCAATSRRSSRCSGSSRDRRPRFRPTVQQALFLTNGGCGQRLAQSGRQQPGRATGEDRGPQGRGRRAVLERAHAAAQRRRTSPSGRRLGSGQGRSGGDGQANWPGRCWRRTNFDSIISGMDTPKAGRMTR